MLDISRDTASIASNNSFLVYFDTTLNAGDVDRHSDALAVGLAACGFTDEDRIRRSPNPAHTVEEFVNRFGTYVDNVVDDGDTSRCWLCPSAGSRGRRDRGTVGQRLQDVALEDELYVLAAVLEAGVVNLPDVLRRDDQGLRIADKGFRPIRRSDPREVEIVDVIPKTAANGKIRRRSLPMIHAAT